MLYVETDGIHDPRINLAIEEHLLRNLKTEEDIFLFYINEPSIIIGKNQNTLEEINFEYVEANHIHVVRRLSGGGAVYHDLNNLNFSFITQRSSEKIHNYEKFTAPIIHALQKLGVPAELNGRNDIVVAERKISGNAQYVAAQRMVSHGTLLFNSDLSQVKDALHVKENKLISKGVKSVRSRVANISEFLPEPMDIDTFRAHIKQTIFDEYRGDVRQYDLTETDWTSVNQLVNERYRCWEWNYGASPEFNLQKTNRFAGGEIDVRMNVQKGVIQQVQFYGDYFGEKDSKELADRLIGKRFAPDEIQFALQNVQIADYFGGVSQEEFIQFLCY